MLDDPDDLAALQRLMLLFVPEAERADFMRAIFALSTVPEAPVSRPAQGATPRAVGNQLRRPEPS